MNGIRGITCCVEFDDLLQVTLRRNMRHLTDCVVITHPADERTIAVASAVPGVRVFQTDAFYRHGARFAKGLAMEESFDFLGRHGWIALWDADVLFPEAGFPVSSQLDPASMYTAPRRILDDPRQWRPELDWKKLPLSLDRSFSGYLQIFHADAPPIKDRLPWYDVTFAHAGGGDGYFESRWEIKNKIRLPFEVLHLGPRDCNWMGRCTVRADGIPIPEAEERRREMERFLAYKGWKNLPVVDDYNEKIEVPGYAPSGYVLRGRKDRR